MSPISSTPNSVLLELQALLPDISASKHLLRAAQCGRGRLHAPLCPLRAVQESAKGNYLVGYTYSVSVVRTEASLRSRPS